MGKVIKFPKRDDNVKGVKGYGSISSQNYTVLGLAAVFLFAIVLNINFQNRQTKSRELANYSSDLESSKLDEYILKSLNSSDSSTEIIYSKKPNHEDKLMFETLVGSYEIVKDKGLISKIQLKPGYAALNVAMLPSVLTQYRKASGMEQLDFRLASNQKDDQSFNYDLVAKGDLIGSLVVSLDNDRKILSINTDFKKRP